MTGDSITPVFKVEYKYVIFRKKKSFFQSSARSEKQNKVLEIRTNSSNKVYKINRYDVWDSQLSRDEFCVKKQNRFFRFLQ